jgi:hypothetical protein
MLDTGRLRSEFVREEDRKKVKGGMDEQQRVDG